MGIRKLGNSRKIKGIEHKKYEFKEQNITLWDIIVSEVS